MSWNSLGRAIAEPLLAPGNLACDVTGVADEGARGLVRMLVNTLVWMLVSIGALLAASGLS